MSVFISITQLNSDREVVASRKDGLSSQPECCMTLFPFLQGRQELQWVGLQTSSCNWRTEMTGSIIDLSKHWQHTSCTVENSLPLEQS